MQLCTALVIVDYSPIAFYRGGLGCEDVVWFPVQVLSCTVRIARVNVERINTVPFLSDVRLYIEMKRFLH